MPTAARKAGFSESSATSYAYTILHQPGVKSPLTEALLRAGVGVDEIVAPIKDGLRAKARFVDKDRGLIETALPDHKVRYDFVELAAKMHGGIPQHIDPPAQPRLPMMVVIRKEGAPALPPPPKVVNPSANTVPRAAAVDPAKVTFSKEPR